MKGLFWRWVNGGQRRGNDLNFQAHHEATEETGLELSTPGFKFIAFFFLPISYFASYKDGDNNV